MLAGLNASNSPSGDSAGEDRAHAGRGQGQPGAGDRRDRVDPHAVALELLGRDQRHRGDAGLGGAVVGLPGVGQRAPDAEAVLIDRGIGLLAGLGLVFQYVGGVAQHREVPLRCTAMTASHCDSVERGDEAVAQDAGVVDHHVEPAELVDRLLDERFRAVPRRDVVGVGDGPAAGRHDLVDHLLGGPGIGALARVAPPRSLTTTLAPSSANSSACSRPMPRPAPVMTATRPSSAPMCASLLRNVQGTAVNRIPRGRRRGGLSPR